MRSSTFYPTRTASCVVLLLLFMNAFSAWAQKITPSSGITGSCMALEGTATYTFNAAPGEVPTWSTRGDIKIVSTGTNTVTIASKLVYVDGKPVSGHGKGRLYATYGSSACGPQVAYVDVFKSFTQSDVPTPNNIVGPDCVEPNEIVTYSINSVLTANLKDEIGLDDYTWVTPAGWTLKYFSSDSSSVTLQAPAVLDSPSYHLKVFVGKCNTPQTQALINSTTSNYSKTIFEKPAKPTLTLATRGNVNCVPLGLDPATGQKRKISLAINQPANGNGINYTWSIPSNWTIVTGSKNTPAVEIEIDDLTDVIKVAASRNGCQEVISEFKVTRTVPVDTKIDGPACAYGDSTKTYTLQKAPNGSKFNWTFAPNTGNTTWAFEGDVTGQTVKLKIGATGGTLSVNSVECPGTTFSLPVKVVPLRPTLKSGLPCLAANTSGNLYEINPVAGAVEYRWVLSGGMLFSNGLNTFTGQTQASITVPSTATSGTLTVTPYNGTCFDSKEKLDYIIGISPATPAFLATSTAGGVTFNPTCYNANVTQELNFRTSTTVSGGVYEWQVIDLSTNQPTNKWAIKTGTSSTSSTAVFVTAGTIGTTGSYRVQARVRAGSCPVSAWGNSAVFTPLLAAMITAEPIEDAGGQYGEDLRAVQTNGLRFQTGTTYQWFKNGTAVTGVTTSNFLRLETQDEVFGQVYRVVVTRGTCTTNSPDYTSDYDLAANDPTAARVASPEGTQADGVSVFPNPSNGEFTLTLPAFKGQAQVALKTLQGRTVFRKEVGQQQSKLAPGKLTTGVYLLQVTLDGKTVTKKVQIQK